MFRNVFPLHREWTDHAEFPCNHLVDCINRSYRHMFLWNLNQVPIVETPHLSVSTAEILRQNYRRQRDFTNPFILPLDVIRTHISIV